MSASFILNLLSVFTIVQCYGQHHFLFDRIELVGNECVTVHNEINVNGTCTIIQNCPSVLSNVLKQIYNHTLCGYEGKQQIICCPNDGTEIQKVNKLNLYRDLDCKLANSNETGVMKFLSECPELNKNESAKYFTNELCDYEICADLVCCPVATNKNRLKKVCSMVDNPIDTLQLRLHQNLECTIKELNMKGRYQPYCDYAERNLQVAPLLQNVCNDNVCQDWYCCPIESGDYVACTEREISKSLAKFVGPKCIDSRSGRQGTCREDYWNSKGHTFNGEITLDRCGSHCCTEYYCCPDDDDDDEDELIPETISAKVCPSYNKYVYKEVIEVPMDRDKLQCYPVAQVAGGRETHPGDYPHMAALGYELDQQILFNCGGSLISDQYVLTAAHCIVNRVGPVKKVRLGVVNLLNDINTKDCPEEYDVARQIPHPEYTPLLSYNDIGLIELDGRVKFNFHIRPICLPTSPHLPKHYESMGWGATGPKSDTKSAKLLNAYQTLFSHEECSEQFRHYPKRKFSLGILNETQICAGSKFSIQSTCSGDSGGPLLTRNKKNNKTFQIYGIVSTGLACGFPNSPGVYTKVYPYVKWIEEIVWNNQIV